MNNEDYKSRVDKKIHGQFYTRGNPFFSFLFQEWLRQIPDFSLQTILEPFAGNNQIVSLLRTAGLYNSFVAFDIQPSANNVTPDIFITPRNTIQDFPKNFSVAITNPPYLAKNSATRDKLNYPQTDYDDMYKLALDIMLKNMPYVAAIIPESFITTNLFHHRLFGVVSLNYQMFTDTDCPVCLALFMPMNKKNSIKNFLIYSGDHKLGEYQDLKQNIMVSSFHHCWRFNDPEGEIGLHAIDGTIDPSIRFVDGRNLKEYNIRNSNRGITRISGLPKTVTADNIIQYANGHLKQYRNETHDVFMTAFRGLRKDGYYRRRLSFADARQLLDISLSHINKTEYDRLRIR